MHAFPAAISQFCTVTVHAYTALLHVLIASAGAAFAGTTPDAVYFASHQQRAPAHKPGATPDARDAQKI